MRPTATTQGRRPAQRHFLTSAADEWRVTCWVPAKCSSQCLDKHGPTGHHMFPELIRISLTIGAARKACLRLAGN